jgi:hypothetical protein
MIGFNQMHCVILAKLRAADLESAYGFTPFVGSNPTATAI